MNGISQQRNDGPKPKGLNGRRAHQQGEVKERHWPQWVMAMGVVLIMAVLWPIAELVLAPRVELLRLLVLCSALGLLPPYRWTGKRLGMGRSEWVFFQALGVGPWLFAGLVGANFLLHETPACSTHAVSAISRSSWYHRLELSDGAFADHPGVRRFEVERIGRSLPDSLRVCSARGITGLEVVVERDLVGPDRSEPLVPGRKGMTEGSGIME